ncbi:MAG: DinB family protein [Pseudomonadota bacterium]
MNTTLAALAEFPDKLEAYYAEVPVEFSNWRPAWWSGIPSEPFTPIEQICHVRDVEIDGYHVRFRRTLEETNPTLLNLDSEMLARERNYAIADSAKVFASFRRARAITLDLISGLTPQQRARTAEFDGVAVTAIGLVHLLCSHDQQHLAGLQWLLARIDTARLTG